ncbi:MAG: hypothetical protein ACREUQ_02770, partial [Burkholderiales bacterium]
MYAIRKALPGDARALAEVAESTFRATFGAMNAAGHMAKHCRNQFGESIQSTEIADQRTVTLLCESAGTLIGFAQVRRGDAPACVTARSP